MKKNKIITRTLTFLITLMLIMQSPISLLAQDTNNTDIPQGAIETFPKEEDTKQEIPLSEEGNKEKIKDEDIEKTDINNKTNEKSSNDIVKKNITQKKAPRSIIVGSKSISSIFPDNILASYIANLLGKSTSSNVNQNDLNTITTLNPSGSVHDLEGIQYLEGLKECRLDNLQVTQRIPYGFINDIHPNLNYYIANNQRYQSETIYLTTGTLGEVYSVIPPLFSQIAQNSNGKVLGTWNIKNQYGGIIDSFDAVDGKELLKYAGVSAGKYTIELQLGSGIWMGFDQSLYIFPVDYNPTTSTGYITGTVTDPAGNPLGGVSITIKSGNVTKTTTTTASDGTYSFTGVDVRNYTVTAEKDGYYTEIKNATVKPGENTIVNFVLVPYPGSVEGVVIDCATKQPIQGATVTPNVAGVASKTTDESGHFYYTNVPAGTYSVKVSADGYEEKNEIYTFAGNATNSVVICLNAKTYKLSGYVFEEGTNNPIVGATVSLPGGYTATTVGDGYYEITGIPAGNYTATASADNYASEQEDIIIPGENYSNVTQNFYLTPNPGKVTVKTWANSIAPANKLPGASIILTGTTNTNENINMQVVSDSNGEYTFELAPGNYKIDATYSGWKLINPVTHPVEINVTSGMNETTDFIFSEITADIKGHVYDKNTGNPIEGATVTLTKLDGSKSTLTTTGLPDIGYYEFTNLKSGTYTLLVEADGYASEFITTEVTDSGIITEDFYLSPLPGTLTAQVYYFGTTTAVPGATAHLSDGRSDLTDLNGSVSAKLKSGSYSVNVTYNGYTTPSQETELSSGENKTLIFYVYKGRALDGIVTDIITGEVIPGATVELSSGQTTTADEYGHYYFQDLNDSEYSLTVSAEGYQSSKRVNVSTPENTLTTEDFKLIPNLGIIKGSVSYSDGTPVQGSVITLNNGENKITDSNGEYYFIELPGDYEVNETTTGYMPQTKETTVNAVEISVVDFILQELPGELKGTITDSNGNAVAGVTITAYPKDNIDGNTYVATTDENGNYIFENISPDDYIVVASKNGFGSVSKEGTVITEQTTIVNFVLPDNPGILKGKVTYEKNGKPVKGATITVMPGDIRVKTDENGEYEILLTEGNYTVFMDYKGYKEQSKKVKITSIEITVANFVLPAKKNTNNNNITAGKPSKTRDNNNIWFVAALMLLSITGVIIGKRKFKQL